MADAIQRLISGIKSFRLEYYERRPERMQPLAIQGQRPKTLVIGCSDSRVDPALLTNAEPGELFVVRNVANLVPPFEPDGRHHGTSAALQFAVQDLEVSDIVIIGHSACGGIKALIDGAAGTGQPREFITPWVSIAARHCAKLIGEHTDHTPDPADCEKASIKGSLDNLMTFPFVRERVESGTLSIHGWWFELKEGQLWEYDAGVDRFRRII